MELMVPKINKDKVGTVEELPATPTPVKSPFPSIRGITFQSGPWFAEKQYAVYVGLLPTNDDRDVPHYIIVNMDTLVAEGSTARLFEARGLCQAFSKEMEEQDKMLSRNLDIVEKHDPDGNVDPGYKEPKRKTWKPN